MDVSAIATAVREILVGDIGSIRTVTAGKFVESLHTDASDPEVWMRARQGTSGALQAVADVRIGMPRRTTWIGPPSASKGVWMLPIDVVTFYASEPYAGLVPARRYDIREQAAEDAVELTLALTWPGNLVQTAAAAATGIVSGLLHPRGEPVIERELWTDSIGLYVLRIPFDAWVQETQAVA